jgi:ketosteroid isomerase-like protein
MVEEVFQAVMAKDFERVMAVFADDAVFYDPHYPQQRMAGRAAIEQGLRWGLSSLEKPGFKMRNLWLDGDKGVAEVDTHHIIRGNLETKFDQVFVVEARDGNITRLQSYVPYGPHGIPGLIGAATRLAWRLQGKIK